MDGEAYKSDSCVLNALHVPNVNVTDDYNAEDNADDAGDEVQQAQAVAWVLPGGVQPAREAFLGLLRLFLVRGGGKLGLGAVAGCGTGEVEAQVDVEAEGHLGVGYASKAWAW